MSLPQGTLITPNFWIHKAKEQIAGTPTKVLLSCEIWLISQSVFPFDIFEMQQTSCKLHAKQQQHGNTVGDEARLWMGTLNTRTVAAKLAGGAEPCDPPTRPSGSILKNIQRDIEKHTSALRAKGYNAHCSQLLLFSLLLPAPADLHLILTKRPRSKVLNILKRKNRYICSVKLDSFKCFNFKELPC